MTRGEGQWHTRREKLSLAQLLLGVRLGLSCSEIARRYNVSPALVSRKAARYNVRFQARPRHQVCPVCQKEFVPAAPNQRCCCVLHRDQLYQREQEQDND